LRRAARGAQLGGVGETTATLRFSRGQAVSWHRGRDPAEQVVVVDDVPMTARYARIVYVTISAVRIERVRVAELQKRSVGPYDLGLRHYIETQQRPAEDRMPHRTMLSNHYALQVSCAECGAKPAEPCRAGRRVLDQPHEVRREFVLDPVEYVKPRTLKRVTATARPGGKARSQAPSRARAHKAGSQAPSRPGVGKAGGRDAPRSGVGTSLPASVVDRIFEQLAAARKPSRAATATGRRVMPYAPDRCCPVCEAAPGMPCQTPSGKTREPHKRRTRAKKARSVRIRIVSGGGFETNRRRH
jgi:hypothetical protein